MKKLILISALLFSFNVLGDNDRLKKIHIPCEVQWDRFASYILNPLLGKEEWELEESGESETFIEYSLVDDEWMHSLAYQDEDKLKLSSPKPKGVGYFRRYDCSKNLLTIECERYHCSDSLCLDMKLSLDQRTHELFFQMESASIKLTKIETHKGFCGDEVIL